MEGLAVASGSLVPTHDRVVLLAAGDYAKELLVAAEGAGLAMLEEDERLLCYSSAGRQRHSDSPAPGLPEPASILGVGG